jgi:hypothetical protein
MFFVLFYRSIYARYATTNNAKYAKYAALRNCSWWVHAVILITGLFTWITSSVIKHNSNQYVELLSASIAIVLVLIVDKHWSNVIMYQAKNPSYRKEPSRLFFGSDSEPQYAF